MMEHRRRILVVADSDVRAATIEAGLRGRMDVHVAAGHPSVLGQLVEEHDPALVVLASSPARVKSALETLAGALRAPPVVLLVDDPAAAWTPAARRAGVRAVLGGSAPVEQIDAAIAAVTAGLVTLHPDVFAAARGTLGAAGEERALTAREREILEMLADGLSNRAIARRLAISRHTVKFHVAAILAKLRASTRTEAVMLGVRGGLIRV